MKNVLLCNAYMKWMVAGYWSKSCNTSWILFCGHMV